MVSSLYLLNLCIYLSGPVHVVVLFECEENVLSVENKLNYFLSAQVFQKAGQIRSCSGVWVLVSPNSRGKGKKEGENSFVITMGCFGCSGSSSNQSENSNSRRKNKSKKNIVGNNSNSHKRDDQTQPSSGSFFFFYFDKILKIFETTCVVFGL